MLASGLGGGISRQLTCGCLTGGVMAIGLAVARRQGIGRDRAWDLWKETHPRATELERRFEARFGSLECRTLIGQVDWSKPEEVRASAQTGIWEQVCQPAVRFVVETVPDLVPE